MALRGIDAATRNYPPLMQMRPECDLNESTDVCVCFDFVSVRDYCWNTRLLVYNQFNEDIKRIPEENTRTLNATDKQ